MVDKQRVVANIVRADRHRAYLAKITKSVRRSPQAVLPWCMFTVQCVMLGWLNWRIDVDLFNQFVLLPLLFLLSFGWLAIKAEPA